MSSNNNKMKPDSKLGNLDNASNKLSSSLLVELEGRFLDNLDALFAVLDVGEHKQGQIRSVYGLVRDDIYRIKPYVVSGESICQEIQESFQLNFKTLKEEIGNLVSYSAKSDSIDNLCQLIDRFLNTLYNFFFAGPVIAEHRCIGEIPRRSTFHFFSSPPLSVKECTQKCLEQLEPLESFYDSARKKCEYILSPPAA